jgi:opacity protein-like surface antigen
MKTTLRILLILCLPVFAQAQYLEAGILVGGANYLGDLSNNSSTVYLGETKFTYGAFARYNLTDFWTVRLGLNAGKIAGQDANVRNDAYLRDRNLSFRTNITEVALTGEFNILGFQPNGLYSPFSPYVFAGVAFTKFTPKARYEGNWVDLQPLGTEGQGMPGFSSPYNKSTFAIPFGVGVKYALTDKLNVGLELGARRTFTDYLDDVSGNYVSYPELLAGNGALAAALGNRTGELKGGEPVIVDTGTQRGDKAAADWYFVLGVTVSYNFLENGLMGSRQRSRGKKGCYD